MTKLNKIEKIFLRRLKAGKFKSQIWHKIFTILNDGNNYWHLAAKTQDEDLLETIKSRNIQEKINSYNKDGILPIHQYLSSIIHFKDDGSFHPYFLFNEQFFNKFLDQKPDLNKFWIYPIYSSWKKQKEDTKTKAEHFINNNFKFPFPSVNILGYPSEMIYLIFKDIFLYHGLPDSVYLENYDTYEKIFNKLYVFDERDVKLKTQIDKELNINISKNYFDPYISNLAISYIAGSRDFCSIIPILMNTNIDFERKSKNDGNTILHLFFGKISKYYNKMSEAEIERILTAITLNKKFNLNQLEISNNFGSSPVSILKNSAQFIIPFFKSIRIKEQILEEIDKCAIDNQITYEESVIEETEENWKL